MYYMGLDIGTTSLKLAVFDKNGKKIAQDSVDYTLHTDAATGFIEFPAEEYVRITKNAIDAMASKFEINALSVDTQGETMILADEAGKALCPAVVWLDNRAVDQAAQIEKAFGRKLAYEVTGQPEISAGWPASKLLWFKQNKPEIWAKTKKIFLLEDWILYNLCGAFVTEGSMQSSSLYFDINTGDWWPEMLDYVGITRNMLPTLQKSATQVGEYKGIKVVTGALDQIAGSLGSGVYDESIVSEMTGTIMAICALTDSVPPFVEDSIIPCHYHAIEGKYCRLLWSSTAGMALKWFKNTFAEDSSFAALDQMAEQIAPGCDGLTMLPYFCGSTMPKYNPAATASFTGITLAHTKAHFARSIMEAIAFTLREDLEYINCGCDEIRITGGGATGKLWPQIKADVTGKRLTKLQESETACLGTALLAMVSCGEYASIADAVQAVVKTGEQFAPNGADYSQAYQDYVQMDKLLNRA